MTINPCELRKSLRLNVEFALLPNFVRVNLKDYYTERQVLRPPPCLPDLHAIKERCLQVIDALE